MTIVFTAGAIDSEGESIHYVMAGEGPALLLAHGMGGNHAIWFRQVAHFAATHRVVAWDQRGFGRSTNRAGAASPEAAGRDLIALMDALAPGGAHLVGQSLGGWAVVNAALSRPASVFTLTLADSLGGIGTPGVIAAYRDYLDRLPAAAPAAIMGRHPALGADFAARDLAGAFLYQQISTLAGDPPVTALRSRLRDAWHDPASLAALTMPVLFIAGDKDDIFPPAMIRECAALVRGARVAVIPGAGHSPYFERPGEWNAVLEGFLRAA